MLSNISRGRQVSLIRGARLMRLASGIGAESAMLLGERSYSAVICELSILVFLHGSATVDVQISRRLV